MKPHALKDADAHRLVCPNGHSGWRPVDGHFWCPACEKNWETGGSFEKVRDQKTGELLDRDDVRELEMQLADKGVSPA